VHCELGVCSGKGSNRLVDARVGVGLACQCMATAAAATHRKVREGRHCLQLAWLLMMEEIVAHAGNTNLSILHNKRSSQTSVPGRRVG
jgi:hypothetical protein